MRELYVEAGNRIRLQREYLHLTRETLAEKADISTKFVYEIEKGNKGFSAATLYRLSKCLNLSCDYILYGSTVTDYEKDFIQILKLFSPQQVGEVCELLRRIYNLSIVKE